MANYLSIDQIHGLVQAALNGGLAAPGVREDLLMGINSGYAMSLPQRAAPMDQIRSDLSQLNGVPFLLGDEVPLKIWLQNAVYTLRATGRPEQALFQDRLNEVATKSAAALAASHGAPPVAEEGKLERIIHQDDLLSYGWLKGALAVGASVARLLVPRYEHGYPVTRPGSPQPMLYKGTGWLIGAQYLITNHHVINARSESEPPADESDLRLQVQHTRVEFDYDDPEADATVEQVESLAAWANWNATPALDYAILKLAAPSTRRPLTLAPQAINAVAQGILPVNIIQHPLGNPKTLGIRNNLVSSLEEWELRYFTDTNHGSSGSPVCNDNWHVIALHRAQAYLSANLDFQGKPTAWVNRGVRLDRIIADLQQRAPDLWAAIGAITV